MKGVRFYQEVANKGRKAETRKQSVIAAFYELGFWSSGKTYCYECVSSVYDEPNSPCCGCGVAIDYLREKTRRISESMARKVHPQLFVHLDN